MNTTNRLPTPQGNNVDRLLTTFYRSEMPATWPDAPEPWTTQTATTDRKGHPSSRSRWALAASVALLIGGCWYVSGQMTDGKKRAGLNLDGGDANTKHVKDAGKDKPKTP